MPHANVFDDEYEFDPNDPAGYRSGVARVGAAAGGAALAVKAFEVPAGESLCPYHYEFEEEWLVVLEGSVMVRTPTGEQAAGRGAVVCFPAGPDGAHKVSNPGSETARIVMFSSAREPAVAVYPDSDKLGVWPGGGVEPAMFNRADGDVDYYSGEA